MSFVPHIRRRHLFSGQRWRMRLVFWGGAVAVGLVSVAFAWAANRATELFHRVLIYPWIAFGLTPAIFVLSAYLARRFFPGSQGSGIPQAIAARRARHRRNTLLSMRLTMGKIALTLLGLAAGASIGREGPTVQVGAAIMLKCGKWGGMGKARGLILAGSAAGVAAAFNTPLAGIVFAIEEMGRAFEQRSSALVLIAVILAGIASLGLVGNYNYFGSSSSMLIVTIDWVAVLVCGIAGGLLGGGFARVVVWGNLRLRAWIAPAPMQRALIVAAACGLIVAACGFLSDGGSYGTGYETARGAVEGHGLAWSFAPLKFAATLASTLSGIPGGLFAPSLSIGAGMGSIIANVLGVHAIGAIVLLGMCAYFAGVVQAPITAAVIIGEMTAASGMRLPLLLAAMIAYGVSRLIQRESLYHALAENFLHD
ncbi:MAG: chloride channel protein [Frankiales bacterium]|nr:chloride channel protein [Frankiales bacterium]